MNEKELRKLSRADLMQLILDLTQENAALRSQLEEARRKLQNRDIQLEQSGSLAEAALKLTGVFEAADAACQLYMENFRRLTREMANNACQQYMGSVNRLSLGVNEDDET